MYSSSSGTDSQVYCYPKKTDVVPSFNSVLTADDRADIQRQVQMFDNLTEGFTTELGKVRNCSELDFISNLTSIFVQAESKRERNEKRLQGINLTYGEISCDAITSVFKWLQRTQGVFTKPGGTFVDLGHGTGKGVLTGALMHRFERAIGIEILEALQLQSEQLKKRYDNKFSGQNMPSFEVYQGDILADQLFIKQKEASNPE